MNVFEAAAVLREFALLNLGPTLLEAIDVVSKHFDALDKLQERLKASAQEGELR